MVLNKIPTFQEVKDWANSNFNKYTDSDAASAAPVQSVDGETGDVALNVVDFHRQSSFPSSPDDGAVTVTESDGSGDDTTSRYIYNASLTQWELDSAVGPSEPTLGVPVAGAMWVDTSVLPSKTFVYSGGSSSFESVASPTKIGSPVDVSSSRELDTTYTNNTGKPVIAYVSIELDSNNSASHTRVFVDGTITLETREEHYTSDVVQGDSHSYSVTIPDGSTYQFESFGGSHNVVRWFEQQITG